MTTYTTIPDSSLEPGKPIRSIDALALRDNPLAIAEGASGAPRVQAAALDTGSDENAWVWARIAAGTYGDIGSYAILGHTALATITPGSTVAGSTLKGVGFFNTSGNNYGSNATISISGRSQGSSAMSGTWKAMSYMYSDGTNYYPFGLWLRIA